MRAFNITKTIPCTIAFTGAGGKSTTMYKLAAQLAESGKAVLVTTTTMIFHPEIKKRPFNLFLADKAEILLNQLSYKKGTITVLGSKIISEGIKIKGFSPEDLFIIQKSGLFDVVLVEADGSRGKPIKAPAKHEPVLPLNTGIVAGLIGIDSLGTKINIESVHRPELFTKITESNLDDIIGIDLIKKLIKSPEGIFKNSSTISRKIVIFNKCDTEELILKAKNISEDILESIKIERILITSMTGNDPVKAVIAL